MNPIRSANLFDLPSNVLLTILAKWLYIQDVCKIDSALLCSSNAPQFPTRQALLSILCSPHIRFSCFVSTIRVDIYSFLRWVDLRKVSIEHQLCIKNSYKHICKRVPSLCDVVGSVDHSTPRTSKTEEATGGVFNYTADSIKNILLAMQLPQGGLRFLDAGCGNAIFATLIQMSFPSAEVVGVDLNPVINTLKSIQRYCSYKPFKNMRLDDVDIDSPHFVDYIHAFQPTHAACIVGIAHTETAFLRAVQATPSVQCVAVAEKRNPALATDFEAFGFAQTHRVAVQLAGSRKKRYVLIAKRAQQQHQ